MTTVTTSSAQTVNCEEGDHSEELTSSNTLCAECGSHVSCQTCADDAVEQDNFEGPLCEDHLDIAFESAEAERQHDMWHDR
jgi:uncharacterized ferredoxin-like protein